MWRIMWTLLLALSATISLTQGLNCIECNNAKTNQQCLANGIVRKCQPNQGSCQNTIRVSNGQVWIQKGCKQTQACKSNSRQNGITRWGKRSWTMVQCNFEPQNTVCRCCCKSDRCNSEALFCRGETQRSIFSSMESDRHSCGTPVCSNRGKCLKRSSGGHICRCYQGFGGSKCEYVTKRPGNVGVASDVQVSTGGRNPCTYKPSICSNGGTCVAGKGTSYSCKCPTGWRDSHCNTPVRVAPKVTPAPPKPVPKGDGLIPIDVTLNFNMTFNDDLKDPTSDAYKEAAETFTNAFKQMLASTSGELADDIQLEWEFSEGSVVGTAKGVLISGVGSAEDALKQLASVDTSTVSGLQSVSVEKSADDQSDKLHLTDDDLNSLLDNEKSDNDDDDGEEVDPYCSVEHDVLFIVESSSHTSAENFHTTKSFIGEIVAGLDIAPTLTRVAVSWANSDEVIFNNSNKTEVMQAINSASYMGDAQPDGAQDEANSFHLQVDNGWRGNQDVPTIVVVLNDTADVTGLTSGVATKVIAVGFADEQQEGSGEMKEDASSDSDAIILSSHYDLMGQIQPVLEKICN